MNTNDGLSELSLATIYDSSFTKKDAKKTGEDLVSKTLDAGVMGKFEFMCNLVRMQEVIVSAVTKLREELPHEKMEVMGVKFTPNEGGYSLNYEEDYVYVVLKSDLDKRIELLKLAQNQDVMDAYGNQVPRVSRTPRKSSIAITF